MSIRSGTQSPSSFSVTDAVTLPFPHLSGAVDIVCVKKKDASIASSPFYVRFGKYQGLLKRREKEVYITVNGVTMPWSMRLGRTGVAYFAPGTSNTNELATISRKQSIDKSARELEAVVKEGATEGAKDIPGTMLGDSLDSLGVTGYSSPEDGGMSPIAQLALANSGKNYYSLDRSLSLDSQAGIEIMRDGTVRVSHNRTASLDAYEGVDLDKANSLEERIRKMAEGCTLEELVVSDVDAFEGDQEVSLGAELAGNSDRGSENGASSSQPGDPPLDSTLDSMPTSWSMEFAAEARSLLKRSGLKAFKSMEISACGQELANCIIENDKSSVEAMTGTLPIGEAGELEMTSAEVQEIFNSKIISKADLDDLLKGGAKGVPDGAAVVDDLVCRVGNVLMKWSDVSSITMAFLAFQECPKECPKHVIALQPSQPVNLSWNIIERTKRQEEKWRFFSWLSSSFRTPEKGMEDKGKAEGEDGKSPDAAPEADIENQEVAPEEASGAEESESASSMFTPSSAQLEMLNLKEGQNSVTFSCYSSLWGTQTATAYIYLMPWNSKVVVSDVDGTITKSDFLGHMMTAIGRDWSHTGVTKLLKDIRKNGYHVMYLSARSIGQATSTRDFLFNLDQNGAKLPIGPVIISPDGILPSLFREMIVKRPDEFKIASLQAIKDLFPEDWNPFYAGFGNRPTDDISYSAVGIPTSRIFTINPKGQVTLNGQVKSTLQGINELVDDIFPDWREDENDHVNHDKYSGYNFWKVPQHEILIDTE